MQWPSTEGKHYNVDTRNIRPVSFHFLWRKQPLKALIWFIVSSGSVHFFVCVYLEYEFQKNAVHHHPPDTLFLTSLTDSILNNTPIATHLQNLKMFLSKFVLFPHSIQNESIYFCSTCIDNIDKVLLLPFERFIWL